jgi:hypothetical protein
MLDTPPAVQDALKAAGVDSYYILPDLAPAAQSI